MKEYFCITNKLKPLYITLLLLSMISILGKIVLSYLSSNEIYIYFYRIINDEIQNLLLYIIIICICIFLAITSINKIFKIVITTIGIILILFITSFSGGLWEEEKSYFEFTSPNNKTIIVEECSWLLDGWSIVYQKINSHMVHKLNGDISTDDGYTPFLHDDFTLEWSSNSVNITYGSGEGKILKSVDIKLK